MDIIEGDEGRIYLSPPIPPDAPAGSWVCMEGEGNLFWVCEEDIPDFAVEAVLAEINAQTAALEADVRARRQVCRRTHGAAFSETLGIVALARAARGQ